VKEEMVEGERYVGDKRVLTAGKGGISEVSQEQKSAAVSDDECMPGSGLQLYRYR
jgi:hypothetical protein